MSDYKILSTSPISNSEVIEILNKKSQESEEISYREEKSLEYLKKTVKNNFEIFNKIKEELTALDIPRLEDNHYIKIIEIMPKNGTELRAILSGTGAILVDENVTKILDVLNKHQ